HLERRGGLHARAGAAEAERVRAIRRRRELEVVRAEDRRQQQRDTPRQVPPIGGVEDVFDAPPGVASASASGGPWTPEPGNAITLRPMPLSTAKPRSVPREALIDAALAGGRLVTSSSWRVSRCWAASARKAAATCSSVMLSSRGDAWI